MSQDIAVWQVKDSNLRSFRDGFTVRGLRPPHLRKRGTAPHFRTYSAQIAGAGRHEPDRAGAAPRRGPAARARPTAHKTLQRDTQCAADWLHRTGDLTQLRRFTGLLPQSAR